MAFLVYDTALLVSGFQHEDVEEFADRMKRLLASNLNLKSTELLEELAVDEEEEVEEEAAAKEEIEHDEF